MIGRLSELPKPPDNLYHYTTAAGLKGIIETQKTWSTHYAFQSDVRDGFYAVDFLRSALERYPDRKVHLEAAIEYLEELTNIDTRRETPDLYVTSFSTHGDQLSQWRGYGSYAIEFDGKRLDELRKEEGNYFKTLGIFNPVEYDLEAKYQYLEQYLHYCKNFEDKNKLAIHIVTHPDAFYGFLRMTSQFKHPSFKEEQEVRLATFRFNENHLTGHPKKTACKTVKFYERGQMLVPYIEWGDKVDQLPIKSVLVAPCHDIERRVNSVKVFLKANGLDIPVRASEIPYRGA